MGSSARRFASLADLVAFEEAGGHGEIVDGELVEKAQPSWEHGDAQGGLTGALRGPFHRRSGDDAPGGWWILPEVDVSFESGQIFRPDLAGWRRARLPERPAGSPVEVVPDWVGEILSPSTASRDLGPKRAVYHRHGVEHYWVVDVQNQVLMVYRRLAASYALVLSAGAGRVRAEPFEAVELDVDALFGRE